jgi:hypothetical protein
MFLSGGLCWGRIQIIEPSHSKPQADSTSIPLASAGRTCRTFSRLRSGKNRMIGGDERLSEGCLHRIPFLALSGTE